MAAQPKMAAKTSVSYILMVNLKIFSELFTLNNYVVFIETFFSQKIKMAPKFNMGFFIFCTVFHELSQRSETFKLLFFGIFSKNKIWKKLKTMLPSRNCHLTNSTSRGVYFSESPQYNRFG
jgi:hypothetical protein